MKRVARMKGWSAPHTVGFGPIVKMFGTAKKAAFGDSDSASLHHSP